MWRSNEIKTSLCSFQLARSACGCPVVHVLYCFILSLHQHMKMPMISKSKSSGCLKNLDLGTKPSKFLVANLANRFFYSMNSTLHPRPGSKSTYGAKSLVTPTWIDLANMFNVALWVAHCGLREFSSCLFVGKNPSFANLYKNRVWIWELGPFQYLLHNTLQTGLHTTPTVWALNRIVQKPTDIGARATWPASPTRAHCTSAKISFPPAQSANLSI